MNKFSVVTLDINELPHPQSYCEYDWGMELDEYIQFYNAAVGEHRFVLMCNNGEENYWDIKDVVTNQVYDAIEQSAFKVQLVY